MTSHAHDDHGADEADDAEKAERDSGPVRAAGTVLWRASPYAPDGVEIALIHRPRYDDWSLPKGKLKRGEEPVAAALRETREETGLDCELGGPLPTTRYPVDGRPKEVRYWAARAMPGSFVANDEVDRMVWLPPAAARHRLTHDHDRPLVDALLRVLES
jgi:8-oxo-dGTP diphosphatase